MQAYRRPTTTDRYLTALALARYHQPVQFRWLAFTTYLVAGIALAIIIYLLGGN